MKKIVPHAMALFALVLLCAAGTAHSAGVDMQEGEWEILSETSMRMGTMSMPAMTSKVTHCLTHDNPVPSSEKEKDCKVMDRKVVGNKVSWRVVCPKGEGEGEITYHGTTYKGFLKMKMVEGGETMTMDMKLSGRHLGPCPKGQKSGPTGETAKQMAAAEQAIAQGKQQQAEQAAIAKNTEAFMKRAVVPAEERGACAQKGCMRTPECEKKIGELNLKPGDYEITIEQASRIGTSYTPVKTERKTVYLDEENPVPTALSCGRSASVKWGKERITWTETPGGGESKGGIPRMLSEVIPSAHAVTGVTQGGVSYHGNSFDGAVTNTMDLGGGMQSLNVTSFNGRRVGDGKPPRGLGYYPPPPPKGLLDNPARKLKGLFGY
ncbi:MAG: hypothetical protein H6Q83_364 [Deltaproteobacteria bacterium]|nr:hypothetical protein [Deltaproteobacteria bacterium]